MEIVLNGQISPSSGNFVLSKPPLTLQVSTTALTLPEGGSVALPIKVSLLDPDDTVSIKISGVSSYESVADNLDHTTFEPGKIGSITLTADEVNSGPTLNSSYNGPGKPVNTLSITASNATPGEIATTAPQSIVVTDPARISALSSIGLAGIDLSDIGFGRNTTLAYSPNGDSSGGTLTVSDAQHFPSLAPLGQYMASGFAMASDGHGGMLITDPALAQQAQLTVPHA
jgi:hypothetical protein